MMLFGYFKGMKYSTHADDFEKYRTFRNTISKDEIIEHCERVNTLMEILDSHLIFFITTRIMTLASPMSMKRI